MSYRFTLISAMYNVARYLPEYFESLERQTYGLSDVQIVLVDDGSTDETLAVAHDFARDRPNVVVTHRENRGQAAARNSGLALAKGEWVSFPDPDDILEDAFLKAIAAAIDGPNDADVYAGRVVCSRICGPGDGVETYAVGSVGRYSAGRD